MLVCKDRNFNNTQEYFDYLEASVTYPTIHNKFYSDNIISENNNMHLNIYEYHHGATGIVFDTSTYICGMVLCRGFGENKIPSL